MIAHFLGETIILIILCFLFAQFPPKRVWGVGRNLIDWKKVQLLRLIVLYSILGNYHGECIGESSPNSPTFQVSELL